MASPFESMWTKSAEGAQLAAYGEKAVRWARTGTARDGKPTWAAPVELASTIWAMVETVIRDGVKGETKVSTATVQVASTVTLARGDYVKRGALTGATPANPLTANALEVMHWDENQRTALVG